MYSLNTETNVALYHFGSSILASSSHERHPPDNALLERCGHRDDKWSSHPAERSLPHWLIVDLGQERTIHKIRIKHAGILEGANLNTADFQLQYIAGNEWKNIVPPIVGNQESVTVHEFKPVKTRFIRLYITNPSQTSSLTRKRMRVSVLWK